MKRARRALACAAATLWLACTPIGKPDDWPKSRSGVPGCVKNPEIAQFLQAIQRRMLEKWVLPDRLRADQEAVVGMLLDERGRIVRVAVFSASSRSLAQSALRAVHASEPYPMPEVAARCLASVTIIGRFRNPEKE